MRFWLFFDKLSAQIVDHHAKNAYILGCGTAASSYHVQHPFAYHRLDHLSHLIGRMLISALRIGQTGIGIAAEAT